MQYVTLLLLSSVQYRCDVRRLVIVDKITAAATIMLLSVLAVVLGRIVDFVSADNAAAAAARSATASGAILLSMIQARADSSPKQMTRREQEHLPPATSSPPPGSGIRPSALLGLTL